MNLPLCIRCSSATPNDDCIFLQCQHIICYNCGHHLLHDTPDSSDFQFQCRCGEITPFDNQVIHILQKYSPATPKQKEDKEVEINQVKCLYCFNCGSECFSIEEYLAGMHKDHDVKYIRKAYEQLEGEAMEVVDRMKEMKSKIQTKAKKNRGRNREIKENSDTQKVKIGMLFDKLRAVLESKEKQLYQQIDKYYEKEYLGKIKNVVEVSNEKMLDLNRYIDEIYDEILSEETSYTRAFQYWNENKGKIQQYLKEINSERSGQEITINKNVFKFDDSLITQATILISKIEFNEEKKVKLQNVKTVKSLQQPEQLESNDSYTQYFRKAKEQILSRNTQIDTVLRKKEVILPLSESTKVIDIPNNIKAGLLKYSLKPRLHTKSALAQNTQNQIKSQTKQRISRIESLFYNSIENVETKRRNIIDY